MATAAEEKSRAVEARKHFLSVEKFRRLPELEQQRGIGHVYQLHTELKRLHIAGMAANFGEPRDPFPNEEPDLAPEALADRIHGKEEYGWHYLIAGAENRCLAILANHSKLLGPLLDADLKSKEKSDRKRALQIIGDLRIAIFFDQSLKVYRASRDRELVRMAMFALRDIGDPRAIAPIVAKRPLPFLAFEILRSLQKKQPPDPTLLKMLNHTKPATRRSAAYALAESGHPSLVMPCKKLLSDRSAEVRKVAVTMAWQLSGTAYTAVYPQIQMRLKDADREVQLAAGMALASKKDSSCAATLVELLKDGTMPETSHSNVVRAMQMLTGTTFGYYNGSDGWKPDTENNRKAIADFEKWIRKKAKLKEG